MMGMGMWQEGDSTTSETLAIALNIYMGETQNEVYMWCRDLWKVWCNA